MLWRREKSIDDVFDCLQEEVNCKVICGGTDLMVVGLKPQFTYIDIRGLSDWRYIRRESDYVVIGSQTTYTDIIQHRDLRRECEMLVQAAQQTGAVAIQNRGTIGGNIANASPGADMPPVLLAYDAEIELVSRNSRRWMPYDEFHVAYRQTQMQAGELISAIRIPRSSQKRSFYRKVGARRAHAITKVGIAACANMNNGVASQIRIAMPSVAPIPMRCVQTESLLEGNLLSPALIQQAVRTLAGEINPIDDIRSTRAYRTQVAQNLVKAMCDSFLHPR